MWLLNTTTLKLEQFYRDFPQYAILSHRWIDAQEATFGDLDDSSEQLEGYRKIRDFCQKANHDGYDYVWADTCCIDQKSSAELGEAINSMYKWYANADVCYVYLADIDDHVDLEKSSWFLRGWTLQELLAPTKLLFFDSAWRPIASRQELAQRLEKLTGIPQKALQRFNPGDYCIALRMSWAANRETTREEDRAYCLLGIFDVNMPLLYGEGSKAFQRLQEEIMKSSTDSSLFIWQGPCCGSFGMLAADPSCFSMIPRCLNEALLQTICKLPRGWMSNNAGITITGMVCPYLLTKNGEGVFILFLREPFFSGPPRLGIFLQVDSGSPSNRFYHRVAVDDQIWTSSEQWADRMLIEYWLYESKLQQLFITRDAIGEHHSSGTCSFTVDFKADYHLICAAKGRPASKPGEKLKDWPSLVSAAQRSFECVFKVDRTSAVGLFGHIVVQITDGVDLLICLGTDDSFRPLCVIIPFCGRVYHAKLTAYHVLRLYNDLLSDDEDADRACDPALHVMVVRGTDGYLEYSTDAGIDLDINGGLDNGEYAASISFDANVFLQQYLPNAVSDEQGCLSMGDRRGLIERDIEIFEMRRHNPWLS